MPIASYAGKTFTVSSSKVYTFDGMEWSGALDTEAQEKVGSKPSTYIKGKALNTMSFTISLRADLKIDVRKEIESWEGIRDKSSPAIFVLGTKPIGKNKWLLKSVAVSETVIDNKGRILNAFLKLSFEEYVRAGAAKVDDAKKKKNDTGIVNLGLTPSSYIDKVQAKRPNPSADVARRNAVEARLNQMGG